MDRHHPDAELRRRRDGARNLMRNVVKLQVEEDTMALLDQPPDQRRPLSRKQGAADLDSADAALKPQRQLGGVYGVVHIEGD